MNPWHVIGWIVLSVIGFRMIIFIGAICESLISVFKDWRQHVKTRDIPPREGQEWLQDKSVLKIGPRWPKGHFTIYTGNASWGETEEEWKQRVRNRKLILIKP